GMNERSAKMPPQAKDLRLQEAIGRLVELFDATRTKNETRLEGKLTDAKPQASHDIKLTAGNPVVIEMESKQFDTYLKLVDQNGKTLAENDDIDPANKNLNSRVWFLPKVDGDCRIIATSYQESGRGAYVLRVSEFAPKSAPLSSDDSR